MVLIKGQLKGVTGQPLASPLSIHLTDYGVSPPNTLYLPAKVEVLPNVLGEFEVDLWANQSSSHPCLYRIETPQGSSFLISIPGGEAGPLDIGNLVVTKPDLKPDTNILHRLAKLEASGGAGEVLTLGDGLTGGSYDGSAPVTVAVNSAIARLNSPTFVNPKSNHPDPEDSSDRLATTSWAADAGNISSGTLPSARLPSNLAAQRLATPRSILGVPFDGTADVPNLTLGTGLLAPNSTSINLDFGVVAITGDARFTNSREWTAPTVTQVEAQAGTDTSRRAWTAQRVWQAVQAWWVTVEASLARVASPAFTGSPTAPTPSQGDASTRLATTEFSSNASNLISGSVPIARIPILNQSTTGNSATTTKLATGRLVGVSGGATATGVLFDGTANISLAVTALDAAMLTGRIADARLSGNVPLKDTYNKFTEGFGVSGSFTTTNAYLTTQVQMGTVGGAGYISFSTASAPTNFRNFDIQLLGGQLSFRRLNDAYTAGHSVPLVITASDNFFFRGYSSLGEGNTGLKCKVIEGTMPATQGASVTFAHGLDSTKITDVSGVVYFATGQCVPLLGSQTNYVSWVSTTSATINIYATPGNSSGLLGLPVKIHIWYRQ